MTFPTNFGRAVDLSGLGKKVAAKVAISNGIEVTAANLSSEILPLSRTKLIILLCWSSRNPESMTVLETLARLQAADNERWSFGTVNVDVEVQVAQALQVRTLPYALALIAEQVIPLFEQSYPEAQISAVIEKVLSIAAEQGIGTAREAGKELEELEEPEEPEEREALAALESGDFQAAEVAYKKWLGRKPHETFAKLGLAQTQLLIRTAGLDFAVVSAAADASPGDIDLQIQCADFEVVNGDIDSALRRLLICVRGLTGGDKDRAKDHLLELFSLIDPTDPRLLKARADLASALF